MFFTRGSEGHSCKIVVYIEWFCKLKLKQPSSASPDFYSVSYHAGTRFPNTIELSDPFLTSFDLQDHYMVKWKTSFARVTTATLTLAILNA
jgi:hypothetical protein